MTPQRRKDLNRGIHARASVIDAEKAPLFPLLMHYGKTRVSELTDTEAQDIFSSLGLYLHNVNVRTKTKQYDTNSRQHKKLFKLMYNLRWCKKTLFNFIINAFPIYHDRLKKADIENAKFNALLLKLSSEDCSNIIKQLERIETKDQGKDIIHKANLIVNGQI